MEDFHSRWLSRSNTLPNPSPKPFDPLYISQALEKSKWKSNFENDSFFLSELSHKPQSTFYDSEGPLITNKEEDNFDIDPNHNTSLDFHHQGSQCLPNSDRLGPLESLFGGNLKKKFEDCRQDYYHIRRSRGISFLSEQEGLDAELARNQESEFIRYFSNQGKQDVMSPKEKVKNEFEIANYMEEDHGIMNMCDFPPTNMLRDLTQCFQPKNFDDDKPNPLNLNDVCQIKESGDEKSSRNLEDSPSKPRKKRKYNPSNLIESPENPTKLQKSQSEAPRPISSFSTKDENFNFPELLEKQVNDPQISHEIQPQDQLPNNIPSQLTSHFEKTGVSSVPKDTVPTDNVLSLFKSKSLDFSAQNTQLKNPEVIGRLFHGFELPVEVQELIGKSKIFASLQQIPPKKIGMLTAEERQVKVQRYQQKRKGRTWAKKINYDCRKKVAETRLRLKGRFVTKAQAFTMLEEEGIAYNPSEITDADIKRLLENALEDKKKKGEGGKKGKNGRPSKRVKKEAMVEKEFTRTSGSERNESVTDGGQEDF